MLFFSFQTNPQTNILARIFQWFPRFNKEEIMLNPIYRTRGQGLTEYIILLLLVTVVSIAAAKSLGGTIKKKMEMARSHILQDIRINNDQP